MTRPSEDIEREVETARNDLDRTVEALKDKMTPGQLIDEISRSFKGSGAGDMMGTLGGQVRENPMAIAMIGAGMAWLMMGKSDQASNNESAGTYPANGGLGLASTSEEGSSNHGFSDAAGRVAEKAGEAASGLKEAVSGAAEHATQGLHDLGKQAGSAGRRAARSFEDVLQQEPLIVGALGLAVGVAIGAALPPTAVEDRAFGAARDKLAHAGGEKLAAAAQGLRASGEAAIEAVKSEADQQGLSGGDRSLVEKAEAVIRSGVEAAKDGAARNKLV
ncbi:hypothetical protein ASE17_19705 [Phenylobacterium sp. Root77]|jgi:ElaB/YqjD/DUF883 family membrane-anchored ribosome-binding protein|uniref:DUF3618 domain-containing protein n=1 Tax=unclassified Phenylobacterium TaxID=2640670 RepID=UPI0006FCEB30|nr:MULTISPECIES: DUF3618 domain-containing protein [unclassified Phenylobacterium]KQW67005.1 hypothetical protein ASC73_17900 [Phenylobacterium sp. Root1277]KQW89698.1 hypothetical protein ASC79_18805 [Phenylobacterium sp. Root1290]KRC43434.1 hypothetical protein ASE17_19705 [Phenylobacterium sp. Root77]